MGNNILLKGIENLASLMKQAQQMGAMMQGVSERLKSERVVGSSGGGMVEAEANGIGEVLRITVEPSLVERGDREMIEDLIPAAVNQALAKARQLHAQAVKEMAGGIEVPGLDEAIGKIMGETDLPP